MTRHDEQDYMRGYYCGYHSRPFSVGSKSDQFSMGLIDGQADKMAGVEGFMYSLAIQWADTKGFRLGAIRFDDEGLYFDANCDTMAALASSLYICNPDLPEAWVKTYL